MERWVGKTAVVTGASAGIGAAISIRLAREGLRVAGLARREELVKKLQAQVSGPGQIYAMRCDVSDPAEIAAAFDRVERELGGVDLLVNNAALLPQGNITEAISNTLSDREIEQTLDVNIKGMILCSRYAVASMKRRGVEGHIININSVAGHYIPSVPVSNVYPCTKHAVTAFCTSLTDELAHAQARIKTTSISPGLVDTEMGRNVNEGLTGKWPMLRVDDVADAVMYAVASRPDVNVRHSNVGNNVVNADQLSRVLDVNTKGVILCAKFAVASMKRRGIDGHIVNINSLAGHYIPFNSHMNVYSASKHAVTAFTGLLNHELADFNSKIKLTSISQEVSGASR